MKKFLIAVMLGIGTLTAIPQHAEAQVNVNINIGKQPLWGPVGYDYAQYYYIPQLNVYYDIMSRLFYYQQGRRWIHAAALPPRFGRYDLYGMHKIVINQTHPYRNNHMHIKQYRDYGRMPHQIAIRDARDNRYFANPQHPRHQQFQGPRMDHRRNDMGRHNGIANRPMQQHREAPRTHQQGRMQNHNPRLLAERNQGRMERAQEHRIQRQQEHRGNRHNDMQRRGPGGEHHRGEGGRR